MNFREATSEDWPSISDISRRSGYEDYINRWGPVYLEEGTTILAEDEVPLGFTKVEMMADGATWLSGLRVDPDHWRKGVGSRLTEKGIEKSVELGAYAARLLIEEGNYRSRNLTEKMNFTNVGKYRFYDRGIDLTGYSRIDFNYSGYVSVRWKFISSERTDNSGGDFFSNDKNLVFANSEKNAFLVLKADEPLKPSGEGMTICADGFPEWPLSGIRPMESFPTAILYEMHLTP